MRSFFITISVFAILTAMGASTPAFSQRDNNHCDKAKSTAESMDCVNRQLQNSQARLNDVYKQYTLTQTDDAIKSSSNKAQQDWIAYRDAQCTLEAALADPPTLARIYELSCLMALTEARADMLSSAMQATADKSGPREFGSRPRWMNVLSHDHPDVFWRYNSWIRTDLNCDGAEDEIMAGLTIAPRIDAGDKAQISFSGKIVLAAMENPTVGKPKAQMFELPIAVESTMPHVCGADIKLALASRTGQQENATCTNALQISSPVCDPVFLYWDGKEYKLEQIVPPTNTEKQ